MEILKRIFNRDLRICLVTNFILSFLLNFAIEAMARQSFSSGLSFLISSPIVFFYNLLIIFATLSLVIFLKHRTPFYMLFSSLWLALGITNGVILSNRMTPFTTKDLAILEDGLSIVTNYLSKKEIILVAIGLACFIAVFVLLFIKGKKVIEKINYKKYIAIFVAILMFLAGFTGLALKTGIIDTFFGNLAYAYRDYGVPYCFLNTWLNTGVSRPTGYSERTVLAIFDDDELAMLESERERYETIVGSAKEDNSAVDSTQNEIDYKGKSKLSSSKNNTDLPNIIFIQLESFIDPLQVTSIEYSEDPAPNFRRLVEKYPSGYLTVPSVGAGTANTEFEMLCGMSVKFFGPGEYPYKAILREKTCESAAYTLKGYGYDAHAIHNHRGAFYGRNKVFANLGFDTFTSLEYMNNVIKTPKNWAKDAILTEQIFSALESSENKDFIFTVSVQGHGKYPIKETLKAPAIEVLSAPTEELRWQYEYYVNQIHEMDSWIDFLTDQLSKYDEKVVLVLYGDHLPALEMTADEMESGDLYKTQYVIWSNYKLKGEDEDLTSYQLMAKTLDMVGVQGGTMSTYHQNHRDSDTYLKDLKMLEHDMLYGKQYIYGGDSPFERTNMRMGINPILIEEIVEVAGKYYIKGQNFTQYSKISLHGEILNTIYLGPTVLGLLDDVDPDDVAEMKISQVEKNKEILSTTE